MAAYPVERQGGGASNRINDLLCALDKCCRLGGMSRRHLGAHFPLKSLELLDGGHKVAFVKRGGGRFQRGGRVCDWGRLFHLDQVMMISWRRRRWLSLPRYASHTLKPRAVQQIFLHNSNRKM